MNAIADQALAESAPPEDGGAPPAPEGELMLNGVVQRIMYRKPDTNFVVLLAHLKSGTDTKTCTVVGEGDVRADDEIRVFGAWGYHPSYGHQFKASSIVSVPPATKEGLVRYLGSGRIKGIGEMMAKRIVGHFGDSLMQVFDEEPDRISEVPGIGPARLEKIKASWLADKVVRDILIFLQSQGITASQARRIYERHKERSISKIKENPYLLAREVTGIGFKQADAIAGNLGVPHDSIVRIRAGVSHVLFEASTRGHCGLPTDELIKLSSELLGVTPDQIRHGIRAELADQKPGMTFEGGVVWQKRLADMEAGIAKRLITLAAGTPPWKLGGEEAAIEAFESGHGVKLAPEQAQAVRLALSSKICVITGGPGVGKSTILSAILHGLLQKNIKIELAAPTGKAAKRMKETTGREAKTIHRLIGRAAMQEDDESLIDCDVLVGDEFSMVDVPLMFSLVGALPEHAALILVGDVDQIPSVGPGQVLSDLIQSKVLPVARLTKIFRQKEGSFIITNAHRVNRGEMIFSNNGAKDFFFVEQDDPEKIPELIRRMAVERMPAAFGMNPITDVQVLCPMNKTVTGTHAMNTLLQSAINTQQGEAVEYFEVKFRVGDRVMQTRNNYDKNVFNGDTGLVRKVDSEERMMTIRFDDREIDYSFDELSQIVLSYAMTIHKSQGSQFPAVIIPVTKQHFMMLQRNLLYTAITRAAKLCVLIGQKDAVAMAIRNDKALSRQTRLRRLLVSASGISQ